MARSVFAPLLPELLGRYPELRIELEPYSSDWSQEPREDVDVFFKVRSPKDSVRRVRVYPGTKRGIFASPGYVAERGHPGAPDELVAHTCIGSGTWKLTRGPKVATPNLVFRVVVSDPVVHLDLALSGLGLAILPLYMVKRSEARKRLVPILPLWNPEPITLCALFSSPARLTPKVQVLLDFLGEYIGTDRDPRLDGVPAKGLFTEPKLMETSGP
jgi:DNA-binding transcriptional LysR family regulator